MGVGQKAADRFMAALRSGDEAELSRWGGTFVQHLRSTGLIDGKHRPSSADAIHVIRAAYMAMWARAVLTNRPVATLLSHEELLLLDRWKLAANPLVPAERREAIAASLRERDPSFPVTDALAARAAQDGDWSAAARWYQIASDDSPDDLRLRANAAYARAKAAPPGR